jgi:hypothetical protein
MALRVRSKSCALSARFLPPSIPAEVTANARYEMSIQQRSSSYLSGDYAYLKFFINTLKAFVRSIKGTKLVALHLKLLLEINHFTNVSISFGGVLGFQFVLYTDQLNSPVQSVRLNTDLKLSHRFGNVGVASFLIMNRLLCGRVRIFIETDPKPITNLGAPHIPPQGLQPDSPTHPASS